MMVVIRVARLDVAASWIDLSCVDRCSASIAVAIPAATQNLHVVVSPLVAPNLPAVAKMHANPLVVQSPLVAQSPLVVVSPLVAQSPPAVAKHPAAVPAITLAVCCRDCSSDTAHAVRRAASPLVVQSPLVVVSPLVAQNPPAVATKRIQRTEYQASALRFDKKPLAYQARGFFVGIACCLTFAALLCEAVTGVFRHGFGEIEMARFSRSVWSKSILAALFLLIAAPGWGQTENDKRSTTALQPTLGGASQADFDTLIDLIQTTIAPTTWDDVGGEGSVVGFPGGVFVDTTGVLRPVDDRATRKLATLWDTSAVKARRVTQGQDLGRASPLRKVSLTRLEAELARLAADNQPPTVPMRLMAGIYRIDYLIVDEDRGEVIIAGPAGPWTLDRQGRILNQEAWRPVLRLDDWVVLLRNAYSGAGQFVCSITPSQEGLSRTQDYLHESSRRSLKPQEREEWLTGLRTALGNQRIEIEGIGAQTRAARILVEADYHMKLVGIGLEPGTAQVTSYLDSIELAPGESPPDIGVLRWWFTLGEQLIVRNHDGTGFRLAPQVIRVLSENEMLTEQGKRVPTGASDELNRRFSQSFTKDLARLSKRYPVYAELDNLFRMAIVAAVMKQEDMPSRIDWQMDYWLEQGYSVPVGRVPREVPSVINHRVVNRRHVIAAVSGGVSFDTKDLYANGFKTGSYKIEGVQQARQLSPPRSDSWWWD